VQLQSENASATFSLSAGGRLASLVVFGNELLITADSDHFGWGAFPMVPYAGRVAYGRFALKGQRFQLPITLDPHAIHGTAWNQQWAQVEDGAALPSRGSIETPLPHPWPLGGTVRQDADLQDDRLRLTLTVTAGRQSMPVLAGWHPWFRRFLSTGAEGRLSFDAAKMYELDGVGIPTGKLVAPTQGPWDDCFTELKSKPAIRWPGVLELTLESSCTHWVVYDKPPHAICVEPQTDAPDSFNRDALVLEAGRTLEATFTIRWVDLSDS